MGVHHPSHVHLKSTQVLVKVRERDAAMQKAASAEDYTAAAAERNALNMLQLRQRSIELELDKEAQIIRYEIGVYEHRDRRSCLQADVPVPVPCRCIN